MTLAEVKERAKTIGVKVGKMPKANIILKIQEQEGNFPCFGSAEGYCNQSNCAWRNDCLNG